MKIKRLFAAAFASLCISQASYAVMAYPGVMTARQADGTEISVRMYGDEHGHYTTTIDGFPLFYNDATRNYEYATLANGVIKGSGIVAANADKRSASVKAFLNTVDTGAIVEIQQKLRKEKLDAFNVMVSKRLPARKAASGPQKILINNFPHTGEQHSIVILLEFKDKQFSTVEDAKQFYTDALNKEGFTARNGADGSARDFFIASSDGAFKPTFDVYGPVQVDYNQHDAGQGTDNTTINMGTLVKAAVEALDDKVDFSKYDHDGDGYVDNVYIFYAGIGASDQQKDLRVIWPHAYDMRSWGVDVRTNDGVGIGSYTCSNEVNGQYQEYPAGIGTFVHEFGHCLGLCDHYDPQYRVSVYTPLLWDTMAGANYNNNSNTPALYSSYEKYALGWIEPEVITSTTKGVFTLPNLGDSNKAYKVNVPGKDNEYFLFENRQRTGWDSYLPGSGMLVWHIDEDETAWRQNMVNTDANHQRVDIVEANGRPSGTNSEFVLTGVPFPGTDNVTYYQFDSWNGEMMFLMDNVKVEDGIASFTAKGSDAVLTKPELTFNEPSYDSFFFSWNKVEDAEKYIVNVAKVNADGSKRTLADYNDREVTATSLTVNGLEENTEYEVRVLCSAGAFRSDEAVKNITTIVKPFSAYKVENVKASDITENSFTATWDALSDAQEYTVALSRETYDGENVATAYDFSGRKAGLPSGWKTNSSSFISTEGCYGNDAPSLRFAANGHYLIMENKNALVSHVEFWMKPAKVTDAATLVVQSWNGAEWVDENVVALDNADGKVYSFDITPATMARLNFRRQSSEVVYIDDVSINGNGIKRVPLAEYTDKSVGNVLTTGFSGLAAGSNYILTVQAVNNGEKTTPSDELLVTTLGGATAISGIAANGTDGNETVYDLSGRRVSRNGMNAGGIYIVKGQGKARKTVR